MGTKKSCKCENCVSACKNRIGWFKYGEADRLAKNMNLTLEQLFKKYLMVDFWEGLSPIFLLAPAKVKCQGTMTSWNPKGKCTLLKKGLCQIHDKGKPFECRKMLCTESNEETQTRHKLVAETWNNTKAQKQIEKLLGEKPEMPEPDDTTRLFNMV